jgi:hypothetical protein
MICLLLEKDPTKRPFPQQLLENPYVKMYMMSFSQNDPPSNLEKPLQQVNLEEYNN